MALVAQGVKRRVPEVVLLEELGARASYKRSDDGEGGEEDGDVERGDAVPVDLLNERERRGTDGDEADVLGLIGKKHVQRVVYVAVGVALGGRKGRVLV